MTVTPEQGALPPCQDDLETRAALEEMLKDAFSDGWDAHADAANFYDARAIMLALNDQDLAALAQAQGEQP